MKSLKHIGKQVNTGSKVLVVFRTIPGESDQALVCSVAQLTDSYHDAIMSCVESDQAQESFEFGEILFTRTFPDGRNMLKALQQDGRLHKLPTSTVIMTPDTTTEIKLDELNVLIAEQKNTTVDMLYTFVKGAPSADTVSQQSAAQPIVPETTPSDEPITTQDGALSDQDLAKSYRSQADAMYKEAARLRREADELDPKPKKTTKSKASESA
jgi:hypothetical protein